MIEREWTNEPDKNSGLKVVASAAGLTISGWYDGGYEVAGPDEPFLLTWADVERMKNGLAGVFAEARDPQTAGSDEWRVCDACGEQALPRRSLRCSGCGEEQGDHFRVGWDDRP